jgi:hypothetical protein
MLRLDEGRAVELIPELLKGHEEEGPQLLEFVRQIAVAGGPLNEEGQERLAQVEQLFTPRPSVKQGRRRPAIAPKKEG